MEKDKIENVNKENNIDELVESKKEHKDEYSIYNYLKNNTAVLIALCSGLVVVITFFTKLLGYIRIRKTLDFWNINMSYAPTDNMDLLFGVVGAIIFLVIFAIATDVLIYSIDDTTCFILLRCFLRKKSKQFNSEELKNLKAESEKLIYKTLIRLVISSVINYSLFVIVSYRNGRIGIKESLQRGFISFISLFIFFVILNMLISIMDMNYFKKYNNSNEFLDFFYERIEECKYKHGLFSIYWLKNRNIVFNTFIAIVLFICTAFMPASVVGDLYVTTIDNIDYVVAYRNEDTYFLEKADIYGRKINVYTDEQMILKTNSIECQNYSYGYLNRRTCTYIGRDGTYSIYKYKGKYYTSFESENKSVVLLKEIVYDKYSKVLKVLDDRKIEIKLNQLDKYYVKSVYFDACKYYVNEINGGATR